jgi:2-polyprenyl-6-hydroxyphenyl methylase/3-demethylubiquinone-9 3-methyltransferase
VGAADAAGNGPAAVRCAYVGAGASLLGFTLTDGHTETIVGDYSSAWIPRISGGGVYAEAGGLAIDYQCIAVEDLAATGAQFDLITCLEVVEHVAGRDAFFAALASLLKPGGLAVFSTPNRTPASWAVVIAGAEHITRTIPKGAHDWNRFFTPAELAEALAHAGLTPQVPDGLSWRPGKGFHIGSDVSVNYFLSATRTA